MSALLVTDTPDAVPSAARARRFVPSIWLRWLGVATFVGAGASFLVEGWTDPNVFRRQLLWAAATLVTTVLGIVAARRLHDRAGARVFLGLAAGTIPLHFTQVGAARHALRVDGIGSPGAILAAVAVLPVLVVPLALGVSALVRRHGRTLTAAMFVLSAPLALSTRNPDLMGALAAIEVVAWLLLEVSVFRKEAAFESVESLAARSLLLLPAAILLCRNAFYLETPGWVASVIGCPSLLLFTWPRLQGLSGRVAQWVQSAGALGVGAACVVLSPHALPVALALSLLGVVGAEVVAGRPQGFAACGAGFLAAAAVSSFVSPSLAGTIAIVPVGTLHALAAFQRRRRGLLLLDVLLTVIATAGHLVRLVHVPEHERWIPAVALSIVLLALGSFLESRRTRLERLAAIWRSHFEDT